MGANHEKVSLLAKQVFRQAPALSMKVYKHLPVANPYKNLHDTHQAIFIHIPKCAGISISECLFSEQVGHWMIWKYQAYDAIKYGSYFKFSFVRNPWDRILSAYTFMKKGGINSYDKFWGEKYLKGLDDFEQFILALENKSFANKVKGSLHFLPQRLFLLNLENKIDLDFLGRFENLENDFELLKQESNLQGELRKLNKSKHRVYTSYYTTKMQKIVADFYQEDIDTFKYSFE